MDDDHEAEEAAKLEEERRQREQSERTLAELALKRQQSLESRKRPTLEKLEVEPNLNHSDLEQKLPASKRQKFQISSTDDDDAPEAIDISSDDNTTPAGGQKPSRPPTTYLNLTSSDSEDDVEKKVSPKDLERVLRENPHLQQQLLIGRNERKIREANRLRRQSELINVELSSPKLLPRDEIVRSHRRPDCSPLLPEYTEDASNARVKVSVKPMPVAEPANEEETTQKIILKLRFTKTMIAKEVITKCKVFINSAFEKLYELDICQPPPGKICRLMFDGDVLARQATPQDHDMDSGCIIDVDFNKSA